MPARLWLLPGVGNNQPRRNWSSELLISGAMKRRIYFGRGATILNWLNERSEIYSKLCDEDCTRLEVVLVNLLLVIQFAAIVLVQINWFLGVGVLATAIPIIRKLNS